VKIKFIALVNLIMEKEVVKELIQEALTTKNLVHQLHLVLEDPITIERIKKDYALLKDKLTTGASAVEMAAHIIEETIRG
jgi:lipid-A-disaccharide synthase